MKHFILLFFLLAGLMLSAGNCDDSGDDGDKNGGDGDSDGDGDGDGDTSVAGTGPCAPDVAATACGDDCAFEPDSIDCATACSNVATVCADADCGESICTPINQDVTTCTAACDGTKTLSCTNLSFGCYAESDECQAIQDCLDEFL